MNSSVLSYYGRKGQLAPWLIERFPVGFKTYLEPFIGSAAVLMAKPRCQREVVSDIDGELINFLRVVRDKWHLLKPRCQGDYGRDFFLFARRNLNVHQVNDDLEAARRFVSANRQPFRNLPQTSCWDHLKEGAFLSALNKMEPMSSRLQGVEIEWMHYRSALLLYGNAPDAFSYLDPPYLFPERPGSMQQRFRAQGVYRHDMGEVEKHIDLLRLIKLLKGKVMVSGYPSRLYDTELKGWNRKTKKVQSRQAVQNYNRERTEVIWMNY